MHELKKGDKTAREKAITSNLALVGFVAARFMGRGYDYEDLYQYGCIGLMKAVDRFDPEYGNAFSTYAVPLIAGEIKRFLRSDGSIHVSRTIRENASKLAKAMDTSVENQDFDELCKISGLERHDAIFALSALSPVKSLSEPIAGDGELLLQDMLGEDNSDEINDAIGVKQALATLDDTERELVIRRYYHRHTQTSIAGDMGLSQVQISRMESKILKKLRRMFEQNTDDGL